MMIIITTVIVMRLLPETPGATGARRDAGRIALAINMLFSRQLSNGARLLYSPSLTGSLGAASGGLQASQWARSSTAAQR